MRLRTSCPNVLDFSASTARDLSELADVGAGDECFIAGSSQDDAAHGGVIPCILKSGLEILPRSLVQSVEDFRAIESDIGDRAFLGVQDVFKMLVLWLLCS